MSHSDYGDYYHIHLGDPAVEIVFNCPMICESVLKNDNASNYDDASKISLNQELFKYTTAFRDVEEIIIKTRAQ